MKRVAAHVSCLGVAALLVASAAGATGTSAPIRLDGSPIRFDASPLSFPSSTIGFPSTPIQTETATTIEVTLPADLLFDFDKADLRPAAQQALREVAELVRQRARGPVAIQGHTDALGGDAYNQKLSERRAAAVKSWLVAREAVPAGRLTTSGLGARNPVAANRKADGSDNPEGRQLNRRVTVILRK